MCKARSIFIEIVDICIDNCIDLLLQHVACIEFDSHIGTSTNIGHNIRKKNTQKKELSVQEVLPIIIVCQLPRKDGQDFIEIG